MQKLTIAKVLGENGDEQVDSTGDVVLDFLTQGPDTFLDRNSKNVRANAERFRKLATAAFDKDPAVTMKISRFFRDRSQQGLKEQALLFIAVLHDRMTSDEIMKILMVHKDSQEGAVREDRIDLFDLVRILSWHKFYNGKKAQVSPSLLETFSRVLSKRQDCLREVFKYKTKTLPYNENLSVGLLDIIGMVLNGKKHPLPEDVKIEYKTYLYPRYRQKNNSVTPTTPQGKEWHDYHRGMLDSGQVPSFVTLEQVLNKRDYPGLASMVKNGRLSPYQIRINFGTIADHLDDDSVQELSMKIPVGMPHEVYSMAKAISGGCYSRYNISGYTTPRPHLMGKMDAVIQKLVDSYAQKVQRRVLCLADTSGSMGNPVTKNSTVTQLEFAAFMSYITAHICSHRVFGTWDSNAHLWQAGPKPSFQEFVDSDSKSNYSTDVVNTIKTVADYFSQNDKDNAPEVITLISDMQFDHTFYGWSGVQKRSGAIDEGLKYFENKLGYEPDVIFWNVNSNTVPAEKQSGVLCMGGYSAANINLMLGAVNETTTETGQTKALSPNAILDFVKEHYV